MKKILITGGAGFIGSHLLEMCIKNKYKVTVFDRYNSNNHWGWLEEKKNSNNFNIVLGDIRDYDSVNKAIKGHDTILHLAALVGIPYSYISPLAYIKTNLEGTYNVLESSKSNKVKQVIIISTSETYGTARYVPIDENHPTFAQSPYAASKIAADQIAMSYYSSFGLKIKIIKPFNTFGPRQSARAIIPSIISQILAKKKYIKIGNLYPTRDLTYVTDTCSAIIKIAQKKFLFGQIFNVGSNKEISVEDLFYKIKRLMNSNSKLIKEKIRARPRVSEVNRLRCDNSKLKKYTKWNAKVDLNIGLIKTINWIKENYKHYKPEKYNI
jgi:dTDP-glucose 4,6-dehydratase